MYSIVNTSQLYNPNFNKTDKLGSLDSLELLDLSYNSITEIKRSALEAYSSLQTLILKGNKLSRLSGESFASNFQLRKLDISSCLLDELNYNGGGGEYLQTLDVSDNNLKSFDWIKQLSNIRYLRASSNRITTLEPEVNHNQLTLLDLSLNRIKGCPKDFPGCLQGFQVLMNLNLSYNNIEHLNQNMRLPSNLQIVDLSSNKLVSISEDAFVGSDSLTKLILSSNELRNELHVQSFAPLSDHLKYLDLSDNVAFGEYFRRDVKLIAANLPKLKFLKINGISLPGLFDTFVN